MRTKTSSKCQRHCIWARVDTDRFFLISAANIGPNLFHQARTVSWQMSMPRSLSRSSTCRNERGEADIHHHCKADNLGRGLEITEWVSHPLTLRKSLSALKQFCSDKALRLSRCRPVPHARRTPRHGRAVKYGAACPVEPRTFNPKRRPRSKPQPDAPRGAMDKLVLIPNATPHDR